MKRIVRSRSAEARVSRSRMSDRRSGHDSESWVYFSVFACCNRPSAAGTTYATATASPRGEPAAPLVTSRQRAREPRDAPESQSPDRPTLRVSRDGASSALPASTVGFPRRAGNRRRRGTLFKGAIAAGGATAGTREIAPNPRIRVRLDVITPRVEPCIEPEKLTAINPRPPSHPSQAQFILTSRASATPFEGLDLMRLARPPSRPGYHNVLMTRDRPNHLVNRPEADRARDDRTGAQEPRAFARVDPRRLTTRFGRRCGRCSYFLDPPSSSALTLIDLRSSDTAAT